MEKTIIVKQINVQTGEETEVEEKIKLMKKKLNLKELHN